MGSRLSERQGVTAMMTASARRTIGLVCALTLLGLGLGLWVGPLARTEGLRAMVGHQMLESGHWIVPRQFGEVYLRKPPLFPWVLAATEALVGTAAEWVWRLPSLLSAAATAGWIAWMTRRWFGPLAGLVGGLTCLGLVPLWSQSCSAEIDALNTLAAVLAGTILLELGFGRPGRRWAWSVGLALSFGAMWLAKGPAGMPAVGGVLLGATVAARQWRWLVRPAVLGGLVAGLTAFGAWSAAVAWRVAEAGLEADRSGVGEVLRALTPTPSKLFATVSTPLIMVAYAFPVSLAAWTATWPGVREHFAEPRRRLLWVVLGSFLAGLALCVLFMIGRPRYGYPILPLLCPLAGALAEAWRAGAVGPRGRKRLRQLMTAAAVILGGLAIGLAATAWRSGVAHGHWSAAHSGMAVVVIAAAALLAAPAVRWWMCQQLEPGAWTLAGLVPVAAVAFCLYQGSARYESSYQDVGLAVRAVMEKAADPPTGPVMAGEVVRNHPEAFWYARVDVRRHPGGVAGLIAEGRSGWLVLNAAEARRHLPDLVGRLQVEYDLPRDCRLVRLVGSGR